MNKYRLSPLPAQVAPDLLTALEKIETATLGHVRLTGFMTRNVQALDPAQPTRAGLAVTLALPAMCSTLMHYAVSQIRPGDMLVVDRLGDDRFACVGGAVARAARIAGAVGVVIDGPVTDEQEILGEGLPVWCTGSASLTTRRLELGGTFNRPVAYGGVPVLPGDIVVADASGVVVLPADEAADEAAAGFAREGRVARTMDRLTQGEKLGDITGVNARFEALIGTGKMETK
ncbi:RraA family protein [Roseibium algae]|uniref:Putative 4-hydroxy-4-methyl-2-oxoglutarate aldolase n=1 Tax=Roseibium algae TaxID=3123038 RepID=A0ABU8THY3_9HYPH